MNVTDLPTIARFFVDALEVFVFESRALAGHAAAQGVARELAARQQSHGRVNIVFAAAPSQNEFLAGLVADQGIDWSRVVAFHMDEYLGIGADHPISFRRYLQEHLFRLVGLTGRPASTDPRRGGRFSAQNLPGIRGDPESRADGHRLCGNRRERTPRIQRPPGGRFPRPGPREGRSA